MNFTNYSRYLHEMYTDKMTIKKYKEVFNEEDGTTDILIDQDSKFIDIPCRLSSIKEDINLANFDINKMNSKFKIFCPLYVDVKKGDEIEVKRILNNSVVDVVKGKASKALKYDLGTEFILLEEGNA